MNCRDVERSLIEHEKSGAARLPARVQKHVLTCNRCGEFLRALNPSIMADAPAPEILRQLEDTLTAGLQRTHYRDPGRAQAIPSGGDDQNEDHGESRKKVARWRERANRP